MLCAQIYMCFQCMRHNVWLWVCVWPAWMWSQINRNWIHILYIWKQIRIIILLLNPIESETQLFILIFYFERCMSLGHLSLYFISQRFDVSTKFVANVNHCVCLFGNNNIGSLLIPPTINPLSTDVPCPTGMFRCSEGKCIPSSWVCNYQKDCEKGEDEFQLCRKLHWNIIGILLYTLWWRFVACMMLDEVLWIHWYISLKHCECFGWLLN